MVEKWIATLPFVSTFFSRVGQVVGLPENARRLLEMGELVLAFPEGVRGVAKPFMKRYQLEEFGHGFMRLAMETRTPIVPVAVVGAEEAMPIFAHIRVLERLTGLLYFPITPTFPHLGLAGFLGYLPAKFKIRFLEPIPTDQWGEEPWTDRGLVQTVADVEKLDIPTDEPVAYVTQTTLSVDDTRDIIAALTKRFTDIQGPDTRDICYATQNRQSAVRDLCEVAGLLLVVGATNSSNSNRLREIGEEVGIPSYLIADGSELDPAWLEGVETVGITAGASAPEVLVNDVIDALRRLRIVDVTTLPGREENITFRLPAEVATV